MNAESTAAFEKARWSNGCGFGSPAICCRHRLSRRGLTNHSQSYFNETFLLRSHMSGYEGCVWPQRSLALDKPPYWLFHTSMSSWIL